MQPSKQSLYSSTLAIAPQRTTVLRPLPALSPVGCNHCNRSLLFAFLELFSSRRGLDRKLATSHRFARERICRSSPDQLLELIEDVRAYQLLDTLLLWLQHIGDGKNLLIRSVGRH